MLKSKSGSNGERHLEQTYLVSNKLAARECVRSGQNRRRQRTSDKGFKMTKDKYRPF